MEHHQRHDRTLLLITEAPLNLEDLLAHVRSPKCGAISTFLGVTRDHFQGKRVVRLEYEAYVPMAEKELRKICNDMRKRWDVDGIAVAHKLGETAIEEASVMIAISSVHRKESLEAVQYCIDELKAKVPIW
jgi:molybdopterin synthase catalytic subunit